MGFFISFTASVKNYSCKESNPKITDTYEEKHNFMKLKRIARNEKVKKQKET